MNALIGLQPHQAELRPPLVTPRLVLRGWHISDAPAALAVFGNAAVARWLSPAMDQVPDLAAMRLLLQQWIAESSRAMPPAGRWAIQRRGDNQVIGGATLLALPPGNEDLELGWQLHPDSWGHGYASETTQALAGWAFRHDVDELFAVVRPGNTRAAAAVRRNGMHWVGETSKYFGLTLQVFRLRSADLDEAAPYTQSPPTDAARSVAGQRSPSPA
ncbi:RimJ/RimL family protein N-acetyltransferase [Prauserella shujinwangii]|uniref:RimJ/RimL family protein N-acetyltransferase n=1 Tax=Prauserella shujinwangii TaxID=1453103 RepID=A0A2T0M0D0_9PSEU|nr:GNAT family N-acetyltransferase [Prauserella shujinwangii]PRX50041.1 RimJ/RimL family protein N-acetyltransferase [Prauserella shujinwangii]